MSWWQDARSWVSEKISPNAPSVFNVQSTSGPANIEDYRQAYREIEIINRCVTMIVNGCVGVPFTVEGGGPTKKINKIINIYPNPFEDRDRFYRRALIDFILDGNAFFYYDINSPGGALYLLPANDVSIVGDTKGLVSHYEYTPLEDSDYGIFGRSTRKPSSEGTIYFSPDEIIHVKDDDDSDIHRGTSRLASLETLFNTYYSVLNFQQQFFKNNAVPGLVLTTDNILSQKIKERTLQQWRQNYSSFFNGSRSPAILDGGLKIDKFSDVNFKELDFENSVDRLQQDMSKALGVPYVILKSGNNANLGANEKLFYEFTIIPILKQFASAFAHFFGPDVIVKPEVLEVAALRPDAKSQAQYWSMLVNGGIATVNEAREQLRLEAMDDEECDHIRVPQNIAGSNADPSVGGRPKGDTTNQEESNG